MDRLGKIKIILSALAITGAMAGPANAMFPSDLQSVRSYVEAGDIAGLRAFIAANPQVLDGTVIGLELAAFMESPPQEGIFDALGFSNPMPRSIRTLMEAAKKDASLY